MCGAAAHQVSQLLGDYLSESDWGLVRARNLVVTQMTIVWTIIIDSCLYFDAAHTSMPTGNLLKKAKCMLYCSDENSRQFGFAVTDVFTDLILLVLPIPIVSILVLSYSAKLIL